MRDKKVKEGTKILSERPDACYYASMCVVTYMGLGCFRNKIE